MTRSYLLPVVLFGSLVVAWAIATSADAQVVYQTYYAPTTTAYYAPAPVANTSYYAPFAPRVSYYAPSTAYYAPSTAYYAPTAVAPTPVVTTYYRPIFGGAVSRVRYVPAPVTYYAPY